MTGDRYISGGLNVITGNLIALQSPIFMALLSIQLK